MDDKPNIVTFAREMLGVELYEGQAEALLEYYNSGAPNWVLLAGRRSGKSLLSDIVACYEAVVPDFADVLRDGEDRYIIIVSTRQDNASLHITNISNLLRHTPALGKLIVGEGRDRLTLSNGVVIVSLPASARAGRGYTASTLILDELAHFVDSLGNQSADAVFDALAPVLATFGDRGRLIITTTPLARAGIVFDLYDRAEQGDLEDFFITRKSTIEMNPKVSEKVIANAMKRDAESAMVEYYAEFRDPQENYLDSAAIDGCIQAYEPPYSAVDSARYVMAIDPAVMGDRYAFVIAHRDSEGRVILDLAHILKPPVNPAEAEVVLRDLVRRFRPASIFCDTAAVSERLKSEMPMVYTPFTRQLKLKIYGSLKEAVNLGRLILYNHKDLIAELKALQIRNGVDISAPKSGRIKHDDLSDCLALVVDNLGHHEVWLIR
jgi:hypothetical protein